MQCYYLYFMNEETEAIFLRVLLLRSLRYTGLKGNLEVTLSNWCSDSLTPDNFLTLSKKLTEQSFFPLLWGRENPGSTKERARDWELDNTVSTTLMVSIH